jgi:vitamin-K-epoxide reductase (warfarin-sensitive)
LRLKTFLSVLANLGSVYLAFILYFVLQDFCIICVSSYITNALLLVFNIKHFNYYKQYVEYNSKKNRSK